MYTEAREVEEAPGVVAVEALVLLLLGRDAAALEHIGMLPGSAACSRACAELVGVASAGVSALRDRSRYPIDVDIVLRWLDASEVASFDECWTVLQRAVFRSAGLELRANELGTPDEVIAELRAALVVASGVVRLVARRRWMAPIALLEGLLDADFSSIGDRIG